MLVLSRKIGQSITIGDQIVITVVRLSRGNVQIGVEAPGHVRILRQEIVQRMIDSGEAGKKMTPRVTRFRRARASESALTRRTHKPRG